MTGIDKGLNDQQMKAVSYIKGPCMVYSGPGSGKTTIIAHRIKHLVEVAGISPSKILVITFTRSAAEEMKKRYHSIASQGKGRDVVFGTFHSIFFRIIRRYYNYELSDILQEGDKYKVIKNIVKTLGVENHLDDDLIKNILLDMSMSLYSIDKASIISSTIAPETLEAIISSYENYKTDCRKIDFDDMITKCYDLLLKEPKVLDKLRKQHQYILIDEFQDINEIQFEIIKMIAHPLNNLFVVGDDDQAIYSFRGSNPEFIVNFHKLYPSVNKIFVNINYRSQARIIEAANGLIANNKMRVGKDIEAVYPATEAIAYETPENRYKENEWVATIIEDSIKKGYSYGDIAILFRTNIQANSLADYLLTKKMPFYSKEKLEGIYDHWVARDLFSYFNAAENMKDYNSILSIINRPTRYISNKSIEAAKEYHKDLLTSLKVKGNLMAYQVRLIDKLATDLKTLKHLTLSEAIGYIRRDIGYEQYIEGYCMEKGIASDGYFNILDELEELSKNYKDYPSLIKGIEKLKRNQRGSIEGINSESDCVTLQTIHGAKGLEYKVVIIVGAVEEVLPYKKSIDSMESIEEERRLFYVAATRAKEKLYISSPRYWYNKKSYPSRFIMEMKSISSALKYFERGKEIFHRIFGKGRVLEEGGGSIKVAFDRDGIKDLDVETCMKNNIIK
ncbi:ATP-dependent helicase [Alkaliphilus serpentinus]|uniref:DNA 3'-5' helicase n=1 Tax=Alkaliphilus serpentinus TaxID=1482731 RepID=A0A833M7R2_9FIRM|nr:ATP-dependent helicase [Alkaliphilus serpentinus]KAB3529087.1 ATP-dependent helicase [Alkaliphilus serpentinus]